MHSAFKRSLSCLAIRVLPHPGGPYNIQPLLLQVTDKSYYNSFGTIRGTIKRVTIYPIYLSRPPMPLLKFYIVYMVAVLSC